MAGQAIVDFPQGHSFQDAKLAQTASITLFYFSLQQQLFLVDPLEHQQTIIASQWSQGEREIMMLPGQDIRSGDISTVRRQLSYFVIFMSDLVAHYAALRDRIRIGSISIARDDYPFTAFCLGYLSASTALPIELLFEFMEALDELAKSKVLSQPNLKQMLKLVQDFPGEAEKALKFLKGLRDGKPLDLIDFIEGHYNGRPVAIQEQVRLVPPSDMQNEGTMELEDIFNAEDDYEKKRRQREEEDIQFARKMQSQFDQQKPAGDEEEMPCEICYVNLFEGAVETLDCNHIFHKDCLAEVFRSNISNKTFPLRCPSEDCQKEIRESDLRAILSGELMEKYQQHTLKAYAEQHGDTISWCPTANCGYMFFHEKDDPERFECLECGKEYCLNCRVEWHKDMSCKEYKISATTSEDDEKFMAFVKGKKFKQCPKCKFWVQKNQGCDHMTCKCKFEFCYKCGGVYMKCQCVEQARIEMENRRRMLEERRLKKGDRKKAAQQRLERKQAEDRRREEERRRKEEQRLRREEQRPRSRRRK